MGHGAFIRTDTTLERDEASVTIELLLSDRGVASQRQRANSTSSAVNEVNVQALVVTAMQLTHLFFLLNIDVLGPFSIESI